MEVDVAKPSDAEGWDRFVAYHREAESYHRFAWKALFESVFGHPCHYLIAREADEVRGVLPLVQQKSLLFGNFLVSVPGFSYAGILADSVEAQRSLVRACSKLGKKLNVDHIELRHTKDSNLDLPARREKVSMRLPLPDSSEVLWKNLGSKLRAQVRRPRKEGAICRNGGSELIDAFYYVFSRNMRDLGTPVFPKRLFRKMLESFPEETRLFVVELDNVPCAAGIVHGYRRRLEIPSASSLRKFNKQSVNMLLYWSVLEYAVENGFKVFDFGRSTVDSGTYRFKKQWGSEQTPLHWDYLLLKGQDLPHLNPQNPKFRVATEVWQRLPLPVANWLGPRIVRNLP